MGCKPLNQGWEAALAAGHTQGTSTGRQRLLCIKSHKTQLSLGRVFRKQNTSHAPSHRPTTLPAPIILQPPTIRASEHCI